MLRFDLPKIARLAWQRRGWLLRVNLAVAALAVALVLLLPRWYTASVTLVPGSDGSWLDLSGTGVGLGSAMSMTLGAQPTPQDQLRMVIKSRALADSLIRTSRLQQLWHEKQLRHAREKLADYTTVSTPKEGQVEVEVEARTPQLALELAQSYAKFAGMETVRLKTSLAAQRRMYLGQRLDEVERELDLAGQRVRAFEELHRTVSLPDQARATLDAEGALQAQVALLETELAATRRFFTDNSAEVQTLRDRVDELKRQTRRIENGGQDALPGNGVLPALKQEYLRLTREQASLGSVAELLGRFYEQARVEESNPVPTFSILDAPELPERPSRPARGITIALTCMVAFAASLGYLVWREARAGAAPAQESAAPGTDISRAAA